MWSLISRSSTCAMATKRAQRLFTDSVGEAAGRESSLRRDVPGRPLERGEFLRNVRCEIP